MKFILHKIIEHTFKPFIEKFILSSTNKFSFRGLVLEIPPSIFHPGLYFSSKFFAHFIETLDVNGKSVLDLGTGSGIQGLICAQKGAIVTAIDVNPMSIDTTRKNALDNNLTLNAFESDLFTNIDQTYDFILVNPPYFAKDPLNHQEKAWYCGREHDYFLSFFRDLPKAVHSTSRVFMVLSDVCALETIKSIAHENGCWIEEIKAKKNLLEKLYIFQIRQSI